MIRPTHKHWVAFCCVAVACALLLASGTTLKAADTTARLRAQFHLPPESARPWVYWFLHGTPRPEQRRKAFTVVKHYGKDSPLLPSGLLGPVTIERHECRLLHLSDRPPTP